MMNQLNGSGRGWSSNTLQTTSVISQAENILYLDEGVEVLEPVKNFGKPLFIYRILDANVIVPVPFADYGSELNNQRYDVVTSPIEGGEFPNYSVEKIAFFRDQNNTLKIRFYPIPTAARVYQIVYATGAIDWTAFEWSDEPAMPEWSHYRCICVALTLMEDCEWKGKTPSENAVYAGRKTQNLQNQWQVIVPEYNAYLRDPNPGPSIDSVGAWYE